MLKRILIITGAAFFLALAITCVTASVAKANGGPHGDYSTTTDACAGCHRTHTAQGPRLLIQNSEYALCTTCHGTGATGANTNVNDGVYLVRGSSTTGVLSSTVNGPLIAGGFVNYKGAAVTSIHDAAAGTINSAWGISGTNRGQLGTMAAGLSCSACHNPHGSTNYRIINTNINGITITVSQVDEGAVKNYTQEHWSADVSNTCDGCHKTYHVTTSGSGHDPTMVASGGYTHRVDSTSSKAAVLQTTGWSKGDGVTVTMPFASQYLTSTAFTDDRLIVCETCHLVHGSSSVMTGFANGGPTGTGGLPGNTTSGDSALLRLDNRGVCEACHQK